jgi:uncharacterized membrane protein YccC
LAFLLFAATADTQYLLIALVLSLVAGFAFLIINYLVASIFNTITVLLVLHFVFPYTVDLVNERAIDTIIGSVVAFGCSYFLPWWEARSLSSLSEAAIRANENFLRTGLALFEEDKQGKSDQRRPNAWPLARRNTLVAFSNFAEGFYRMMGEPHSRQQFVAEYNHLLIQNHILAAEIVATVSQLRAQPERASAALDFMGVLDQALVERDLAAASLAPPTFDKHTTPADWLYPLKQMQRAVQSIIRESTAIRARPQS